MHVPVFLLRNAEASPWQGSNSLCSHNSLSCVPLCHPLAPLRILYPRVPRHQAPYCNCAAEILLGEILESTKVIRVSRSHEVQQKGGSYAQERRKYCKQTWSKFTRADWDSCKRCTELSSHCWCLNSTQVRVLDTRYFISQTLVVHQHPLKTLDLTGLKNSACVSWPSLGRVQVLWGGLPIWTESFHLMGLLRLFLGYIASGNSLAVISI